MKNIALNMRLLKEDATPDAAMLKDDKIILRPSSDENITIYAGQTYRAEPPWSPIISTLSKSKIELFSEGAGAALFIKIKDKKKQKDRTMCVSFGTVHLALNKECFEKKFGLKITLNSVPRTNLRSFDTASLDAAQLQKRLQASKDSDLNIFGIDIEKDLVRVAVGTPSDKSFASALSGKDSLLLNSKIDSSQIREKCQEAFDVWQKDTYKKDYGWIDNILEVTEKTVVNALDKILEKELNNLISNKASDLFLSLPEIVDHTDARTIAFHGSSLATHKTTYADLNIDDYILELRDLDTKISFTDIKKSHQIVATSIADSTKIRWRVYESFVCETDYKKQRYVLFAGNWYEINNAFYKTVESDFVRFVKPSRLPNPTLCKNEREFISEVDNSSTLDYANFDQLKINPSGANSAALEPCDFYTKNKEFIHLKDGTSSHAISHLWMQGLVSARAFIADEKFRRDLRIKGESRKVGIKQYLPLGKTKPTPADYKIIFGILRNRHKVSNKIDIPFFSKVSSRPILTQLSDMGFSVEVQFIEKL